MGVWLSRTHGMKHLLAILALTFPMAAIADFLGDPVVLDGDTMSFAETKVDLFGVHAPTITQTCGESDQVWSCGWEAALHLEELVSAGDVVCVEADESASPTPLVRCTAGGVDLAGLMIDAGLAVRDETLGGDYAERELAAAEDKRGIWAGPFVDPVQWAERTVCACSARKKALAETAALLKDEETAQ